MKGPDHGTSQGGIAKACRLAAAGLGLACACVLLIMMSITGMDVVARYVFNAPIAGAFELVEILMVVLVYMALPLAILSNAHVEVELWEPKSRRAKRFVLVLGAASAMAVFAVFSIELYEHAQKFTKRETVTNSIAFPLKYVAYAAMVGAVSCFFFAITNLIERLKKT